MRWWIAAIGLAYGSVFLIQEVLRASTSRPIVGIVGTLSWVVGVAIGAGLLYLRFILMRRGTSLASDEVLVDALYSSEGGLDALSFGHDEGMLCEVDGWLHFRGRKGEWSLSCAEASRQDSVVSYGSDDRRIRVTLVGMTMAGRGVKNLLDDWEASPRPSEASTFPVLRRRWPWLHAIDAMFVAGLMMLFAGATAVVLWGNGKVIFLWQTLLIIALFLAVTLARSISRRRLRWARWQAAEPLPSFSSAATTPVEVVAEKV